MLSVVSIHTSASTHTLTLTNRADTYSELAQEWHKRTWCHGRVEQPDKTGDTA